MNRIIQIIPAPPYIRAKYKDGNITDKVDCLALMEDGEGDRYICAMCIDSDGLFYCVNECSNFECILTGEADG